MTNIEKFVEIFGFVPFDHACIIPRPFCNGNPAECEECSHENWWRDEYDPTNKRFAPISKDGVPDSYHCFGPLYGLHNE